METAQEFLTRIGKKGGEAAGKNMTEKQRKRRATKAAKARWSKKKP
jgi:hypothetical protein